MKELTQEQEHIISTVVRGDAEEIMRSIPDRSVDLVLTDPPYAHKDQDLWVWLARESARVLKVGGSLISLTGHFNLPFVLNTVGEHLRFWWICGMAHPGNLNRFPGKWVCVRWKPAIWFVNERRFKKDTDAPIDLVPGEKNQAYAQKELHKWGQPINWFVHYIERLTPEGGVVLDPFAGSLTTAMACKLTGRRYICIEQDQRHLDKALPVLEAL